MAILTTRSVIPLLVLVGFGGCASPLLQEFALGNREFSAEVYKALSQKESGNFLVCPMSVLHVMALAGVGARGDTSFEMNRGLRLPQDPQITLQIFNELSPHLRGTENYALTSANKIYVKEGFTINADYKDMAVRNFAAGVDNIDFSQSRRAAAVINQWVEKKTNNKIHQLVDESDLTSITRMVLVNAMHFKGRWMKPFDVYDTVKSAFYGTNGDAKLVDMMQITDYFNYYESKELDCKFLEVPYEGQEVSMVFVLPNQLNGLSTLESRASEVFKPQPYTRQHIRVQIPKFSMETTVEFKPILEQMGIRKVFSEEADLSGISPSGGLRISKVIQKNFINVTEEGTEAAAATAGGVITLSIPAPAKLVRLQFKADHPYLLYLQSSKREDQTPIVLFTGRYGGPKA